MDIPGSCSSYHNAIVLWKNEAKRGAVLEVLKISKRLGLISIFKTFEIKFQF